ncbi:uncharacterized protein Z519_11912 [Cladophialophora bantiana CBS 173.52]|uniref:Uncharacterized protein n=1 Tax=Cladophialophora bantiana (strain ATCC 10958 / CBS 173.52 / CDC B-1940 / NIH 8579) TaxID=1442370 RepID=A0A0D2FLL0_CLAB1|nr:uncharacterized protein Z519_11912 [Cladophialophora bantiana CBS 173.52]KIW87587.1 hypothetical protein Z519_11912 [Cladophialophora bantiana CBS 173.52]
MADHLRAMEKEANEYFRRSASGTNNIRNGGSGRELYSNQRGWLPPVTKFGPWKKAAGELDAESQGQNRAPQATNFTSYYLTCTPTDGRIPILIQARATSVNSDNKSFDMLQKAVKSLRKLFGGILVPHKFFYITAIASQRSQARCPLEESCKPHSPVQL